MEGLRARVRLLLPADDHPHEELLFLPLYSITGSGPVFTRLPPDPGIGRMKAVHLGPVGPPGFGQLLFQLLGKLIGILAGDIAAGRNRDFLQERLETVRGAP